MFLLLVLGATVAVFALIGRQSMPKRERIGVRSWTLKDLASNTWRGLSLVSSRSPLEYYIEELNRTDVYEH